MNRNGLEFISHILNMRLLMEIKGQTAFENMAEDEAIMNCGGGLTLRLYRWEPRAVSLGYFQSIEDEVDVKFCKDNEIDLVRRTTGGGTVFHDRELTYSILVPLEIWYDLLDKKGFDKSTASSYRVLCTPLIRGMRKFGVNAEFSPINDLEVCNKKLSGNAQTRREGYLLQHGTILFDLDLETMFRALKVSEFKIRDKRISSAQERVTSITSLGINLKEEDLAWAIAEGFGELFSSPQERAELSDEEKKEKGRLRSEKYSQGWWNHLR